MESVFAADWITHSSWGGIVGYLLSLFLPEIWWAYLVVFLVNFIPVHWLLDLTIIEFMPWPPKKHWLWIAIQGLFTIGVLVLAPEGMLFILAGVLGGIMADVIDGFYGFVINREAWHKGELLFWFHRKNPNEEGRELTLTQNIKVAFVSAIGLIASIQAWTRKSRDEREKSDGDQRNLQVLLASKSYGIPYSGPYLGKGRSQRVSQ